LNGDGQTDFVIGALARIGSDGESIDESRLYIIFGPYGQKDFIRGDANSDGALDISDPVTILSYLYSGGEKPACLDAVDVDDSGILDISDAIYLLNFLYQGGPAPPQPYPTAGKDTTPDALDCLGFEA
jgi:hypothetical protein